MGFTMTKNQQVFMAKVLPLVTQHGPIVSRRDLKAVCAKFDISVPSAAKQVHAARGMFDLSHLLTGKPFETAGPVEIVPEVDERSDAEIEKATDDRFDAFDRMVQGMAEGKFRSIIAGGNAGIGKTYTAEYILEGAAHDGRIMFTSIRGYVKPTGLYKLLWESRHDNCVLMFDDADSVFDDEIGLNILKGALDTTKRRTISWRSEKSFEAEDGEAIPNSFDFHGSVIFITNKNFDNEIRRNTKLTPHLEALISRSFYLDLYLQFPRELMVRIKSVVRRTSMLDHLSKAEQNQIITYMEEHMSNLRELSLRMALKLSTILKNAKSTGDFVKMAGATCLKRPGA